MFASTFTCYFSLAFNFLTLVLSESKPPLRNVWPSARSQTIRLESCLVRTVWLGCFSTLADHSRNPDLSFQNRLESSSQPLCRRALTGPVSCQSSSVTTPLYSRSCKKGAGLNSRVRKACGDVNSHEPCGAEWKFQNTEWTRIKLIDQSCSTWIINIDSPINQSDGLLHAVGWMSKIGLISK